MYFRATGESAISWNEKKKKKEIKDEKDTHDLETFGLLWGWSNKRAGGTRQHFRCSTASWWRSGAGTMTDGGLEKERERERAETRERERERERLQVTQRRDRSEPRKDREALERL